ncbi:hypothetical protein [Pseudoduganella rhizocola]|uniref:hypothetical protein n=1 Tax=Pseudoduganella rhizocola TaxID=3382643 RepID=UPI0038B44CDC
MDSVKHGRDDEQCKNCIFCGVAEKQLLAPCVPDALIKLSAWPARYVFPSCEPCQDAALDAGQILASTAPVHTVSTEPVDTRLQDAMSLLASRLAKAMFYEEHGRIFPDFGAIYFYWAAASAPPIPGFSVEEQLDRWGKRDTVQSGISELDREFSLEVAPSTCAVALNARITNAFSLLVFADTSPDRMAADTHELYDVLPGGLHQAQAGLYE